MTLPFRFFSTPHGGNGRMKKFYIFAQNRLELSRRRWAEAGGNRRYLNLVFWSWLNEALCFMKVNV